MNKLLLLLFVLSTIAMSGQTTYEIEWTFGTNSDNTTPARNADRTVELGDTVRWVYVESGTHTVTSSPGAVQQFDTNGRFGAGFEFEVVFNTLGENPYVCTPHPGSMYGTITVVETLSVEDKFRLNLNSYPNPVQAELTITSLLTISRVEVYSILGKKVLSSAENSNLATINMSELQSGLYLVNVTSQEGKKSVLKVFKK